MRVLYNKFGDLRFGLTPDTANEIRVDYATNADTLDHKPASDFIYARGYLNRIDLDDIKYPCSALAINCVHSPSDQWGTLLVYAGGTGSFTQIYIPTANDGTPTTMYFRHHGSTGWTSWRNTADGGNAATLDGFDSTDFLKLNATVHLTTSINSQYDYGTFSCEAAYTPDFPTGYGTYGYLTVKRYGSICYQTMMFDNGVIIHRAIVIGVSGWTNWQRLRDGGNAATLEAHPASDFVLKSDYDALAARVAALEAK